MKRVEGVVIVVAIVFAGCVAGKNSESSVEGTPSADPAEVSFQEGRRFFREGVLDSAAVYLEKAWALDTADTAPLALLGHIYYQHAMATSEPGEKEVLYRKAVRSYAVLERRGGLDSEQYGRMTELAHLLDDKELFARYAEKHGEKYPGDRQSYNIGLANYQIGKFDRVIETQKAAIANYPLSPFVGGFYRLLGDAYFEIDRQQTAERTYEEGVGVAEERMKELSEAEVGTDESPAYRQLLENRRGMLLSLRKIYRLHGKSDKMEEVDLRLERKPF